MSKREFSSESADAQVILNQIVANFIKYKKHKTIKRWIKAAIFLILIAWISYFYITDRRDDLLARAKPHIGMVEIVGTIADGTGANSEDFMHSMEKAFGTKSMKAMIIKIDSPGGSPVQADDMYDTIRYFRDAYPEIKTYAVCGDSCVSAGYYVASAAEQIYANPSSLIGSIGVIYNGFGFVDSMQKVGATRRLFAAGDYKGFMDPFTPVDEAQKARLQTMLNDIHQTFIDRVKQGRGNRLQIDEDTFSGLFWTGTQAKQRGLIDGYGNVMTLAREKFEVEDVVDYTYRQNILTELSRSLGVSVSGFFPKALGVDGFKLVG